MGCVHRIFFFGLFFIRSIWVNSKEWCHVFSGFIRASTDTVVVTLKIIYVYTQYYFSILLRSSRRTMYRASFSEHIAWLLSIIKEGSGGFLLGRL